MSSCQDALFDFREPKKKGAEQVALRDDYRPTGTAGGPAVNPLEAERREYIQSLADEVFGLTDKLQEYGIRFSLTETIQAVASKHHTRRPRSMRAGPADTIHAAVLALWKQRDAEKDFREAMAKLAV